MNSTESGSSGLDGLGEGDTPWQSGIDAVASDRVSGASALALNLARALIAFAQAESSRGLEHLRHGLLDIAREVLSGQGSMAPPLRILNDAMLALDEAHSQQDGLLAIQRECARYTRLITTAPSEIVRHALPLLQPGFTVLTLSHSSAVETALLAASDAHGGRLHVICLESRPGLEGRTLASRLASGGLRVTLAVDAAADELLRGADVWLAGADSVTVDGIINKVGTAVVAACAARLRLPGYILCDSSKLWPTLLPRPRVAENNPAEVWDAAPQGVAIHNRYFDLTSWELVQAVLTERGQLSASRAKQELDGVAVHPALRATLGRVG